MHRSKTSNYGGVYPIPIYTMPNKCGGSCIYCPKSINMPNSYIVNEDTKFAFEVNFSPDKQFDRYIDQINNYHGYGIPIEIILLGGSFSAHSKSYRRFFIEKLYNHLSYMNLENKKHGIMSEYLCSILSIESRPDQITNTECNFLRSIGVSKIEIGVQHVYDRILEENNREHSVKDIIDSTYLLKSNGFKVGYHVMIGLPGSTFEDDCEMLGEILWKPEFSPDYIKIYPCELLKNRIYQPELWNLFTRSKWNVPSEEYIMKVLNNTIESVPTYVRISRITRQFQNKDVLQKHVFGIHDKLKGKCNCIRCREIGKSNPDKSNVRFQDCFIKMNYNGNDTSIEVRLDNNTLVALARIYKKNEYVYLLRELHVYGKARHLGLAPQIQGNGIGSELMRYIESLLLTDESKTILINVALGAREFFRKHGYEINSEGYLIKKGDIYNKMWLVA
jgi:elongator complex protein 3